MKCFIHSDNDAVGICVSCSKAICAECLVEVQGKIICRECLAVGISDPSVPSDITDNDKMMALLSHVIPFLVPIIILLSHESKQRKFQRYHAIHALTFASTVWVIVIIIGCVITVVTLGYGSCIAIPLFLLPYIPAIYYGVQAYQGNYIEIPLITDLVKSQHWV